MKRSLVVLLCLAFPVLAPAADILWVSDQLPIGSGTSDNDGGAAGVFGSGPGPYPDQGIISMLTNAGHVVDRFNPANATPLSAAELGVINTYDLLIIGRSIGSAAFDSAAETTPWNTLITVPILMTNTYISRSNRLGWFTGGPTQPDVVSNPLTFTNPASPVSSYLIDGVSMSGATTTNSMTEAVTYPDLTLDIRGTSLITDPIVAGGNVIATSMAPAGPATFIASWPAGTTLAGTSAGQSLAGYRLQFLAGNRESATAPNNTVGSAGFENLTPEGEGMFLRAVDVAVSNGTIPEPSTAAFLALAGVTLLRRRRKV